MCAVHPNPEDGLRCYRRRLDKKRRGLLLVARGLLDKMAEVILSISNYLLKFISSIPVYYSLSSGEIQSNQQPRKCFCLPRSEIS